MKTTDMTRRGFLRGLVAVGTVAALGPLAVRGMLTLYGDGVHDDTAALQALINGERVVHNGTVYVGRPVYLPRGDYRLTTLRFGAL